jgi:5-methylcytosine-specific restriction endonuclease McrA
MDLTPQLLEKLHVMVETNNNRNRRKVKKGKTNRSTFTYTELFGQYLKQCGICPYCQDRLKIATMTIEHVQPVSFGGQNHINNIVIACLDCNHLRNILYNHYANKPKNDFWVNNN